MISPILTSLTFLLFTAFRCCRPLLPPSQTLRCQLILSKVLINVLAFSDRRQNIMNCFFSFTFSARMNLAFFFFCNFLSGITMGFNFTCAWRQERIEAWIKCTLVANLDNRHNRVKYHVTSNLKSVRESGRQCMGPDRERAKIKLVGFWCLRKTRVQTSNSSFSKTKLLYIVQCQVKLKA